MLAAASYSRIGFIICLAVRARRVRVTGGSASHLEPGTIGTPQPRNLDILHWPVDSITHTHTFTLKRDGTNQIFLDTSKIIISYDSNGTTEKETGGGCDKLLKSYRVNLWLSHKFQIPPVTYILDVIYRPRNILVFTCYINIIFHILLYIQTFQCLTSTFVNTFTKLHKLPLIYFYIHNKYYQTGKYGRLLGCPIKNS